MTDINWGIIGPGRIAQRFAEAMSADNTGNLHAVASSNEQRGQAFADKYEIPIAYTDYDALYQDPVINAIYIATPHMFHFEQAVEAIKAGKHLLVEKPITINVAQAEQLFALAKQHNVFVMEGMWSLFLPVYLQANNWIAQNLIGDIQTITSTFGFAMPRDNDDRWLNLDLAGGVLLDMGVYNVATSQWFAQQNPVEIQSKCIVGDTGVDEATLMQLHYPNGIVSQLNCSFHARMPNELFIYGSKGYIKIHGMFWDTQTVTLMTDDMREFNEKTFPFDVNGFEYQIREVEACIKAGKLENDTMTHQRTLDTLAIMDNVRQAHGVIYPGEHV